VGDEIPSRGEEPAEQDSDVVEEIVAMEFEDSGS